MKDLHELPKLRDSLSYLYVDRAIIEQKDSAVELINEDGKTHVPAAMLCVLMLGPGTTISHAAVKALAENGCMILWTGEEMTRFYACGMGETRKAYHLLQQAALASDPVKRTEVVLRMYRKRFQEELAPDLTLPQIRGLEGVRVRDTYARASREYEVEWSGRNYDRNNWNRGDPVNRALSAANALLNAVCQAAIVSGGYSPAIGFVHTGKQLSFVYDVADLYKTELTIPAAFETAARYPGAVEVSVRILCRERFREAKLLERILPDIDELLGIKPDEESGGIDVDIDGGLPEELWGPLVGVRRGE